MWFIASSTHSTELGADLRLRDDAVDSLGEFGSGNVRDDGHLQSQFRPAPITFIARVKQCFLAAPDFSTAIGDPKLQAADALNVFQSQIMVGAGLFGSNGPLRNVFRAPVNPFLDTIFDYSRICIFANAKVQKITLTQPETFTRFYSDPPLSSVVQPSDPKDIQGYLEFYKQTKKNNVDGPYMSSQNYFILARGKQNVTSSNPRPIGQ